MNNLLDDFKQKIFSEIQKRLKQSKTESKHIAIKKCLPIEVGQWREIVMENGKIIMLNESGQPRNILYFQLLELERIFEQI